MHVLLALDYLFGAMTQNVPWFAAVVFSSLLILSGLYAARSVFDDELC